MLKFHLLRVGMVCLGLLGSALAFSAPVTNTQEYCSRPIRVAFFEFGAMYRSATSDGVDARLMQAITRRTGCEVVNVVLPRSRIWAELQGGTLDVATAAVPTPERKAYGYLLPYMKTRNVVLLKRAASGKIKTMAEFEASYLRLGVVRSFRHEAAYDSMIARLREQDRVVEAVDVTDDLRMLVRGVVDAILSQPLVYREYLDDAQLRDSITVRDWAPQDQFSVGALILSRKSFTPEQAKNWDALIAQWLRDGTVLKISRTFMPAAQARELLYSGPRSPD